MRSRQRHLNQHDSRCLQQRGDRLILSLFTVSNIQYSALFRVSSLLFTMQGASEASVEILTSWQQGGNTYDEQDSPSSSATSYSCCPICYEDGPLLVLSHCNHAFCKDCLQEYCRVMFKSRRNVLITCPMTQPLCTATFAEADFPMFLLPENKDLYQGMCRRMRLINDATLSQCPNCDELVEAPPKTNIFDDDDGVETVMVKCKAMDSIVECEIVDKKDTDNLYQDFDPSDRHESTAIVDSNTRTCSRCEFIFCALHGSAHLHKSCADYTSQQAFLRTLHPSQYNTIDLATQHTLQQYTKPCPHCGVAICKASGCDHIVCPLCYQDFCFACGTHAYLTGSSMIRSCQRCQKSFVDHRYEHQRSTVSVVLQACVMIPLLLPGWLLYMSIMSCFCVVTGCFGCCFGCGKFAENVENSSDDKDDMQMSGVGDIEANFKSKQTIRSVHQIQLDPAWTGVKQGIYLIFLPVICLLRDLGVECNSFPRLLPGERDHVATEIPSMTLITTESEDSS